MCVCVHTHMYACILCFSLSPHPSSSLPSLLSGWLGSSDDPLGYVDRIDRRIEDFTGLTMETAEQLQVSEQSV